MEPALQPMFCLHCGSEMPQGAGSFRSAFCCAGCEVLYQKIPPSDPGSDREFGYLDQSNFREIYENKKAHFQFQLYVEGLHCSSCVHLLEYIPEYDDLVLEARVQFSRSQLSLRLVPHFSLSRLVRLLKHWGYEAKFLNSEEAVHESLVKENRESLKRIAVAGACAGNIMLFVIPVYAGLTGVLADVFNWMSFVLFLPILLYSAQPFYRGTWMSLRYHVVNVDLPITIALWGGFVFSTVNLLLKRGEIYYDSTATFIFLILSARYLLKRVQQNHLAPVTVKELLQQGSIQRQSPTGDEIIPHQQIQVGDVLMVKPGESLPVDAVLLTESASIDLSLLNGESFPQVFSQGMHLSAGSTVLERKILVRATSLANQSRLAEMLEEIEAESLKKTALIQLTDRWAQRLIFSVFLIAIVFFAFYFPVNPQEAFNRTLALIVLACPCALAFGAPLTYGLAMKKAQSLGIWIKNGTSFDKILKVKNIFFDKTGTLTTGQLRLVRSEPAILPVDWQNAILSLERDSFHPVAFALRAAFAPQELSQVENRNEVLGWGVQGEINGDHFSLQTLSESIHDDSLGIVLIKNKQPLCRLYFEDPLRPESKNMIEILERKGFVTSILSGDRKSRVYQVGSQCGLSNDRCAGELFPEDKKAIISGSTNTCMIGDGSNDALALAAADVGIAVKGSMPLSMHATDIYFLRGGLSPVFDLIQIAHQTRRTMFRNITLALVYNVIGGALALTGMINPLIAAVLMPISSGLIVASTLWGVR